MGTITIIGLVMASLITLPATSRAALLESPAQGATLSGIGFISGWKCAAGPLTVTIDGGAPLPVAMHQARGDLRPVCGTIHHGFIRQINWALLGDGEHTVVAYDDGVEFARATFTVGTTGEEFLTGVRRQTVVPDFPSPGETAVLEWNESTQHFEIRYVWSSELSGYDRAWWRQCNVNVGADTYREAAFLYAEEPAVDICQAGRLTQAAKDRALDAMNQIRALHGLQPVQYSSRYDRQVQAAGLIQAANRFINHRPSPSAKCYSPAGAEESRTSNLWRFGWRDRPGVDSDPALYMVSWTNDSRNISRVAAVGHRRWVLNPFSASMASGQMDGDTAQKVSRFDAKPAVRIKIAVDFVASSSAPATQTPIGPACPTFSVGRSKGGSMTRCMRSRSPTWPCRAAPRGALHIRCLLSGPVWRSRAA